MITSCLIYWQQCPQIHSQVPGSRFEIELGHISVRASRNGNGNRRRETVHSGQFPTTLHTLVVCELMQKHYMPMCSGSHARAAQVCTQICFSKTYKNNSTCEARMDHSIKRFTCAMISSIQSAQILLLIAPSPMYRPQTHHLTFATPPVYPLILPAPLWHQQNLPAI